MSKNIINTSFSLCLHQPLGSKYGSLKIPDVLKLDLVLLSLFMRGLFDTDGSICFKRRYRDYPYYPVISLSTKSEAFCREISTYLKSMGFRVVETYNYRMKDPRADEGFTIINRIELNGMRNLNNWLIKIGFDHPKNIKKIKEVGKIKYSGGWI